MWGHEFKLLHMDDWVRGMELKDGRHASIIGRTAGDRSPVDAPSKPLCRGGKAVVRIDAA